MAKKQVKKEIVEKAELVYSKHSFNALEEVEYLIDFRPFKKGDKDNLHPNTAELLRYNGIVK